MAELNVATRFNLRDLGGLPAAGGRQVVRGRLFRGAGLHRLDGADLDAVAALRPRLVIDLRSSVELSRYGRFPSIAAGTTVRHLPMFETMPAPSGNSSEPDRLLSVLYGDILEQGSGTIAHVVRALADSENLPMLFYCAAGKDRTGVTAAIVLGLLGVPPETIVDDYTRSHEPMGALLSWMAAGDPAAYEEMVRLPDGLRAAPADAMRRFLLGIEQQHRSVAGLLETMGIEPVVIECARRNLLT